MLSLEQQSDIVSKSKAALDRINSIKTENAASCTTWKKPNYSRLIFEDYSDDAFSEKLKRDSAYYNVLFKRLDESESDNIHIAIGQLMNIVKSIYEHINIKPKIYGLNRLPSLDHTDDVIQENANRIVSDFINRNYYSLTKEQREAKYEHVVKDIASEMIIKESVDPKEAVKFATKVSVIESLLEHINFPSTILHEIETCLSSKEYNDFFEQDKLAELWENFKDQSHKLSKVIASVV